MQSNPHHETTPSDPSTEKLQSCLRGELSAVETYELALASINHVALHHALQEILASHGRRAELLRTRLVRAGTAPMTSSGVWGAFAKAVQMGADLMGDRVAIAALEEGEDRGLELYTKGLDGCSADTLRLIDKELFPEQQRTHALCRQLKTYVKAPS
jgi:demethoxyubiquinone hydroxylase (CLK1/Coq7/Cat5 family)